MAPPRLRFPAGDDHAERNRCHFSRGCFLDTGAGPTLAMQSFNDYCAGLEDATKVLLPLIGNERQATCQIKRGIPRKETRVDTPPLPRCDLALGR